MSAAINEAGLLQMEFILSDPKSEGLKVSVQRDLVAELRRMRGGIAAEHQRSHGDICATCCGNEYHCETYHDHGPDKPICATRALIA